MKIKSLLPLTLITAFFSACLQAGRANELLDNEGSFMRDQKVWRTDTMLAYDLS